MEEVFYQLNNDCVHLILDLNQITFILPMTDEYSFDNVIECLIHFLKRQEFEHGTKLKAGISEEFKGIKTASTAYQQAKNALNMCNSEEKFFIYAKEAKSDKMELTVSTQGLLYDALLSGDFQSVSQIFSSLENLEESTNKEMLFYTLEFTIQSVWNELRNSKLLSENMQQESLPFYNASKEITLLMDDLKKFCESMCKNRIQSKQGRHIKNTEKIVAYIQDHYTNPGLTADMIAKDLSVSSNVVFNCVREQSGKSLSRYVEDLRIEKAENLLLSTDLAANKIFEMCGFGSEKTFYRAFSKKHGVSPGIWKKTAIRTE